MGWGLCITLHLTLLQHIGWCHRKISQTQIKTTFCTLRCFFNSFTASGGSERNTAGRVASPRSIMVRHGFRSKEAWRAKKQNIDYAKQHRSPHCWLPAKLMHPANSTKRFSWLTRLTPFLIVKERSNIYIYN